VSVEYLIIHNAITIHDIFRRYRNCFSIEVERCFLNNYKFHPKNTEFYKINSSIVVRLSLYFCRLCSLLTDRNWF
jgi:hypothetical protein